MEKRKLIEKAVSSATRPINGQYPRPWMTNSQEPWNCRVFTIGRNQRNGFPVELVGDHETYLTALFNRDGQACRALYNQIVTKPSPTRINTDRLVSRLSSYGVSDVIETNVICYSTPMSADLRRDWHTGGKERGTELFQTILDLIRPKVIVAHGTGTAKDLSRLLDVELPKEPTEPEQTSRVSCGAMDIWVIPSLAPPRWNMWMRWAEHHMDLVSREVAEHLAQRSDSSSRS